MPNFFGTIQISTSFIRTIVDGQGLRMYGSSSGYVGLKPAAAAGAVDYELPAADGSSGQALTTNGSGVMSWSTISSGVSDHGALTGLSDDDHSIYALLAGRSTGQTINGGTGAAEDLTLVSTTNATKGLVQIGSQVAVADTYLQFQGTTSGYVGLKSSATGDNTIYTLPASDGASGTFLKTNGSGVLVWSATGELTIGTSKTTSFTATDQQLYPIALASVTADISLTFPTSPTTGDVFGIYVSSTHSSGGTSTSFDERPFFCIEPANGTSINGSAYSAVAGEGGGKYSLWQVGECLIFQYTGSTWQIIEDGRIPITAEVTRSTTQSISNNSTTDMLWTVDNFDTMGMHSTSTNTARMTFKRTNVYQCLGASWWDANSTGLRFLQIADDSSNVICRDRRAAQDDSECAIVGLKSCTPTEYIRVQVYQNSGSSLNTASAGTYMRVLEVLA